MMDLDQLAEKVENAKEPVLYEQTDEVEVRIIDVREGTNKHGLPYISPVFVINGEAGYKPFNKYLPLPDESMDEEDQANAFLGLQRLCKCFDLDIRSMFNPDETINIDEVRNATGWVTLGVQPASEKFEASNYIRRMVANK